MDTIDIKNDEINVEDFMRHVRDNIKKRKIKESEFMTNDNISAPISIDSEQNLNYINSNWDIHADYNISSHRPVLGRLLVWGRRLVHGEVKRYVDIVIGKQTEFNARIVRLFNGLAGDIDSKINNAIISDKKKSIDNAYTTMNYFLFEEQFRGDSEDIKQRQSIYVNYFKNCQSVLDIGCGRGEFLSLLKENGIYAKGIDINEDMVLYCQKIGLDVKKIDMLSYLESLDKNSLDGVFLGQVVEHLNPEDMMIIIKLLYEKLKFGSHIIIETVNVQNPGALANFFVDPTHKRPVHPKFLEFIMKSTGFRDTEIVYRVYDNNGIDIDDNKIKEIAPDYAIICKK